MIIGCKNDYKKGEKDVEFFDKVKKVASDVAVVSSKKGKKLYGAQRGCHS